MTRDTRHSSLLTGLLCLFATQLPLANAQVADIEKATNASLLWGPYRPNLYFGVRPRIPKSLMGGLLWTRVEDYTSVQNSECIHTSRRTVHICELQTYERIACTGETNC
jgi:mannosyl-oligosaccharide glucosidase